MPPTHVDSQASLANRSPMPSTPHHRVLETFVEIICKSYHGANRYPGGVRRPRSGSDVACVRSPAILTVCPPGGIQSAACSVMTCCQIRMAANAGRAGAFGNDDERQRKKAVAGLRVLRGRSKRILRAIGAFTSGQLFFFIFTPVETNPANPPNPARYRHHSSDCGDMEVEGLVVFVGVGLQHEGCFAVSDGFTDVGFQAPADGLCRDFGARWLVRKQEPTHGE
jgi:hypothetical protein